MKGFFFYLFILIASLPASAATPSPPAATAPQPPAPFPDQTKFPVSEGYESNVRFWMRVYGEWSDSQMVIHDSQNMDVVFDVVDYPDENSLLRSAARASLTRRLNEIKTVLLELDADRSAAQKSPEHQRILDLYKNNYDPDKFRKAAENLRVQQGIKERFGRGLEQMNRYIAQIQQVLRQEGLPEEIGYLPLVESSFNNQSLSKTRAAGIWQFMPGTARRYMKVNNDVDERLDPYVSTRAAAHYLKRSYQLFGNWPVALMSYNHGQEGMVRAMNQVGSADFVTILTRYQGRLFKFASRNFYAEFIAACRVMHDAAKYFPNLKYENPLTHTSVKLTQPLYVSALLGQTKLTKEVLREYNPALQSAVLFARRPIPAGYELRLPADHFPDPEQSIANLRPTDPGTKRASLSTPAPASVKSPGKHTYVVRKGDTLFSISQKFDTTVDAIRRLNGLNHSMILPGQRLHVPSR